MNLENNMNKVRWVDRIVYFCLFIASITTIAEADVMKFEPPENKSIFCVESVIILDITQYGKDFKGKKLSQNDVDDDGKLATLRKWWKPASLAEYKSIHLEKKSLSPQSWAKIFKRKNEYIKNRDILIYSECSFIHKDKEYCYVSFFTTKEIAGKDIIDSSGVLVLKKIENQWKIASPNNILRHFRTVFSLMPSDVFAYMVFGTEYILDQAIVKRIDKDKLIDLRRKMLNSEGELNMVDFSAYVIKVLDGYQDEEMANLLIKQPPKNMIKKGNLGISLDKETICKIKNDLADLEPKLLNLVIKKLQSDGVMKAVNLLRRYGGMNLKEAVELVGSWGVNMSQFEIFDSGVSADGKKDGN